MKKTKNSMRRVFTAAVVFCFTLALFPAVWALADDPAVYNHNFCDGAAVAANCKGSIGVEGTTHAGAHALWGYAVSAYIAPTETRNNQWFYVNLGELPAGGYEGSIQINRVVVGRATNIKTAAYVVTKAEFDAKGAYGAIQDKTPAIMPASLPSGTGYSTVNLADFDVPETGECLILFVGTDPWVGQDHEVNLAERTFFLGMAEIREKTLEPFSYAAFSESSKNIPVGKTAAPKLLLYRANDFAMSKDGAVISYSLSDVSPAGAFTIVDAAAGRVRANVKNGTAVLTAEVTVGAVTKYASINLTATDYTGETLTYDYNGYISLDYARDATLPEVGPDFFYKAYPDKPRCGIVMNPRTAPTESRDYHWVYINLGELDTGRYSGSLRVTSAYNKTSESVSAAAYLVTKAEFDAKGAYGAIQGKTPVNIPTDMASHTDMRTLTLSGIEVSDREECLLLFLGTDAAGDNRSFQVNRFCVDRLFLQSSKPQALSRVEFTPAKTTLEASESVSSQVFAYTSIGEEIDDLDLDISYSSANTDVATVDENGNITGVAGGQADITASVTVDGVTFSDTITITVSGAPALTSLTLISPPTKTTYIVGEEIDLSGIVVTGTYTDGSTGAVNVTADNISGFDSSTDNPSQEVTVTVDGKTATFDVKIVRVLDSISATGKITIDGYADEPAWEINKTLTRSKSGGDNTATFGTLWDEDNLYVFVDVVDDVLVTGSNKHYYDDGVEVYIDGDMVKGAYNEHSAQYTFRYGDDTVYVATADTVPPTASTEGVEHKTVETANGYAMEIKIPWSNIGGLTVNAGKTIGFTIHVNDKDTLGVPAGKVEDILTYTLESDDADFEDWLDSTNWAEMTLDAWSNPVEDLNDTGTVSIGAEGAPAGAITATVNGQPIDITNPGDLTLGDVVEMNADPEPEVGKEFLFWMDPVSKRLISNQQQVTFTVGTDTQITAVYKDAGAGHIVIFFDRNGKVLKNEYLADGAEITAPETPYSVGYRFTVWSPAVPATANDDYAFVAQYEEEDDVTYEVTVENGSISPAGGSYKYNTEVTVTAGSAGEGRKFAYWTKNGVIVSYSPNYSFYVWDDAEIRAVSVPISDNVTAAPAIYMDDNVKTDSDGEFSRLIFASERTMPAGYTLIETGILISEDSSPDLKNHDEKAVAQSASGSGQFTARVDGLTAGATRYARAYMIYKIGGDYKVIYSNTVVGTV